MNWFYLALSSTIFFAICNLLNRKVALSSGDQRAAAVAFNLTAGFLAVLVFILTGAYRNFNLPFGFTAWFSMLVAAFFYAMFERGRFIASKYLDASVLTTISNVSLLVAFIGSLFLYSESLTIQKLIGGALILTALVVVSYAKGKNAPSLKGVLIGVLINALLGIGWMLDKRGTIYFNSDTYNILVWTVPLIFIYLPYVKFSAIKEEFQIGSWKIWALAGLNVAGYWLQLKALEIGEATKVIPIVQTSTLVTVVLGILILKERNNLPRKFLAGGLAVAGTYLISTV